MLSRKVILRKRERILRRRTNTGLEKEEEEDEEGKRECQVGGKVW